MFWLILRSITDRSSIFYDIKIFGTCIYIDYKVGLWSRSRGVRFHESFLVSGIGVRKKLADPDWSKSSIFPTLCDISVFIEIQISPHLNFDSNYEYIAHTGFVTYNEISIPCGRIETNIGGQFIDSRDRNVCGWM